MALLVLYVMAGIVMVLSVNLAVVVEAQLAWSPILVDSESQVDLWTRSARGCACPWQEKGSKDTGTECACCVREGGCPCGQSSPTRCSQCGLEQHCGSMCNITLDSRALQTSSGRAFGQIKSPSMQGPASCKYVLRPAPGQRVELQVYRLVSVGKFNGTSCEGGFLQLGEGPEPLGAQLCGANERYTPPAVLFADHGATTLIFQINEQTVRSQFLAYFSFTSLSNPLVGFHPKGGSRVQRTECDWLYQDFACRTPGSCSLASPGFPGIYPPGLICRYHITTSSVHTRVRINFKSLLLPHNHCESHHITLFGGATNTAPVLAKICGSKKSDLLFPGPNLLLEFSSGYQVPPFDYNGFSAGLEFLEGPTSTIPPPLTSVATTDPVPGAPSPIVDWTTASKPGCDVIFSEADSRSGHFDTRGRNYGPTCRLIFKGRPTDVVHVSLFNYRLRSPSCRSVIEVVDGLPEDKKSLHKMCSPVVRHARDPSGRFLEPQAFVSTGYSMSVILRRAAMHPTTNEVEFVDGAYLFHDEELGGTLQPMSMCDAHYYGLSSPSSGQVEGPGAEHLFWNVEGSLRCSQHFIPAANQSVTLTIKSLERLAGDQNCETACGDGGCHCMTNMLPLEQMDHLLLLDEDGRPLSCLCGSFRAEWLPVSVRTWTALHVLYSVAHYSWSTRGYSFQADFKFDNDGLCGQRTFTTHSGELTSQNVSSGSFNSFYHQQCTWILDSNVERQLFVDISTNQSRPCTAWNVSVHEFSASEEVAHVGPLLHTFCPRDKHKVYSLPWKLNTIVLRVQAMTRTPPVYSVKWRSQVVRANTRLGAPTPAPNAVSRAPPTEAPFSLLAVLLYLIYIYSTSVPQGRYI